MLHLFVASLRIFLPKFPMIKDYQIIIASLISNIELTGYSMVTPQSCKSWSSIDFIDRVLILDGQSLDKTSSLIKEVAPKCEIVRSKIEWRPDVWTWEILEFIENEIVESVNEIEHQNKILITVSSDNIFTKNSVDDLRNACISLIESKDEDFINLTFRKAITKKYVSNMYPIIKGWHVSSISKFREGIHWKKVKRGELGIETSRPINQLMYNFKYCPISYDMFGFSKENLIQKIERHPDFSGKKKPTHDDYIERYWLKKLNSLGIKNIELHQHPQEARAFIEKIDYRQFGHDLFGHVDTVRVK